MASEDKTQKTQECCDGIYFSDPEAKIPPHFSAQGKLKKKKFL